MVEALYTCTIYIIDYIDRKREGGGRVQQSNH